MFKREKEKLVSQTINISAFQKSGFEDNHFANNLKGYMDYIFPSGIDVIESPRYINIDGAYVSTLLCIDFPYEVKKGFLDKIINFGEGVEITMYHEPQDKLKIVKNITHVLGFTKHKSATGGDNQVDSGLIENAKESSKYMKQRLADGEEFFFINLFIRITGDSPENLEEKMRRVESELAGKNIMYQRADFRQLEAYISSLPINMMDKRMKEQTEKNILSSGLAALYPFTASSLSDPEGMFIGINDHDNTQIILDIFNTDNYPNANMIVCGRSGIGKSFTTQMLAGRFRMQKIPVMIIAPLKGHEYKPLCENVGGNYFKLAPGEKNGVNMMAIRPTKQLGEDKASYLADKISKLKITFSLMMPNITEDELDMLDEPLKRVYEQKGITFDNASLYKESVNKSSISLKPSLKDMPMLEDLQKEISDIVELKRVHKKMEKFVTGSLSFLNTQTNIDLDNDYTVADISDIEESLVALVMFIVLDIFWDKIKADRTQKKVVILDELWKLIGSAGNVKAAEYVLEIFKIIRGYGGAAIGTTQDISDFLFLEDGKYGKGIINACSTKIVLGLENLDAEAITKVLRLSEEEFVKIIKFGKGEGLMLAGTNHVVARFKAFKTEERLINTDRKKLLEYEKEGA